MFEAIRDAIASHDPVIIHRHSSPDGDALGSQAGLKALILANYPGKTVYAVGDDPGRYEWISGKMDDVADGEYSSALAVILDTSSPALISDERYARAKTTARIDHHLFLGPIAQIEAVDSSFESCCGLVAQMAAECGWRVTDEAALALFTGMVTDSGRFRYDATTARTFRLAARLMEHGIDLNALYRRLYASSLADIQLRAEFVRKIRLTPHGVAYIYTTREEMTALDAGVFAISRGMVSVMNDIEGVDIWVNFTEAEGKVLCELRSSRFDINPIAVRYGGGGHKKASGATLSDRETALRMLDELDQMAEENRP